MIEALYLFQGQTESGEIIEGYYNYDQSSKTHYIMEYISMIRYVVIPTTVYLIKQPQ